jgi:hypothetical protein
MRTAVIPIAAAPTACTPDCADHDEDCAPPHDYVACWTYAPERGMCPYLRAEGAAQVPATPTLSP